MTRVTALPFPPAHSALPTPQPTLLLFKAAIVGALRRATSDDGLWGRVPLVIQLAYVAFIHGRVEDLMAKLSFVWMTSATSWTIKAMRKPYTRLLLALQLLFLPVLLALAATGAILASPLVPLFGLPLFALGFPRPKRFAAKVCIYVHEAGKRPGEGGGQGRQSALRGSACFALALRAYRWPPSSCSNTPTLLILFFLFSPFISRLPKICKADRMQSTTSRCCQQSRRTWAPRFAPAISAASRQAPYS